MMRLVSMPMSWAVSGSCAVACMARPVREVRMKKARAAMHSGAAMIRKTSPLWMLMEPRWYGPKPSCGKTRALLASGYQLKTACWRARDRPMAVMRGARRGAPRSGR